MASYKTLFVIVAALSSVSLVLAGLSYSSNIAKGTPFKNEENLLTLAGVGIVSAPPDRLKVSLGVETFQSSAEKALSSNNEAMSKAIRAAKDLGVKDDEIRTLQVSLSPVYDREQKLIGFTASNTIRIVSSMLDKGGISLTRLLALVPTGSSASTSRFPMKRLQG